MVEIFHGKEGDRQQDIINRMNNRLFELEEKGHVLVGQRSFSDRRVAERAKKATKKLNRLKAKGIAV